MDGSANAGNLANYQHLAFGGGDVILAGDMGQLPSVFPASLATPLDRLTSNSHIQERQLWTSIKNVHTIKSQKRGAEDPYIYAR
jgi:hypothetical protein